MIPIKLDELKIFSGCDIPIKPGITIHQPTLGEIRDLGEGQYWRTVYNLTATPSDLMIQLDDLGEDFTKIDEFEVFCKYIAPSMPKEKTYFILGDLDLASMDVWQDKRNGQIYLGNEKENILIDRFTYITFTKILREMHCLKKNMDMPANEYSKRMMLEDARDDYEINKDKPFKSILMPLISSMVVMPGFKHDEVSVFNMKICPFMDATKRNSHIKQADILLQSGYSGFGIKFKDVDKNLLSYTGTLN